MTPSAPDDARAQVPIGARFTDDDLSQRRLEFTAWQSPHDTPVDALITGASGFIGWHLAERLLNEGKRVRLLVRRPEAVADLAHKGAEVVVGSLSDAAAIRRAVDGARIVYHLAAMTCAFSVQQLMRANRGGTRAIARACADQPERPVLVQVSSVAAAGPTARGHIRSETETPSPVSNYGRSKLSGELAAAEFAGEVPITIVRPGIVFGPRNREMLPMFRTIKYGNFHPVPGWNTPPLSLLHIDDALEILLRAAERGSRLPAAAGSRKQHQALEQLTSGSGVYFAAAPEYPDYAELGRMMRSLLSRPYAPILPVLGPFPWIVAGINERLARLRGRPESFNLDKIREAQAESWACSPEKAATELGCQASKSLTDHLASTVAWYRANAWL
jgi:nucleoside-diphosphate-sugar epimerase